MNLIDLIIIVLFLGGMYFGVKKGFIHGTIFLVGLIFTLIISFALKGKLASVLLKVLPFINFSGNYAGLTSLNILLYEGISFLLIFLILFGIFGIILKVSHVLQNIIDNSLVLTLPSKLLGLLVGFANTLIICFVALFICLEMNFYSNLIMDSKLSKIILERTAFLSNVTSDVYLSYEEINDVVKSCKFDKKKNKCNIDIANTMIKYNVVSKDEVTNLIKTKKLKNIKEKDLI